MSSLDRLDRSELVARVEALEKRVAELEGEAAESTDLELFGDIAPIPMVASRSHDGQIFYANELFVSYVGFTDDPRNHKSTDYWMATGQREAFRQRLERDGRVLELECQFRRPDGRDFWAVISSSLIRHRGEAAMLTVFFDVTARRRAEEAMRESTARFRAIADATPYPIFIARRHDGRILYSNGRLKEAIGFDDDPTSHFSVELYWDPGERQALLETLSTDGKRLSHELRHRRANGEMFWAVTSSVALEFDGEEAMLTSFFDNTDRKRAEEELERYHGALEDLVAERTAALEAAQAELLRRERLAAIGQLTGTVAHELRNPLGTIRMSQATLERAIDTPGTVVRRVLERMNRSISRCTRIIDELLDYSRIRAARPAATVVDEWIAEVMDEHRIPASIELGLALRSGVTLAVDRERLRQAVINVVDNACQAMLEADVASRRLEVSTRAVGARMQIEVSDNGPGIDAEVLERIFEPLFSTRSFGVGLGLPLVKQVMAEHGGDVEVSTSPGGGTSVTLWLPLAVRRA